MPDPTPVADCETEAIYATLVHLANSAYQDAVDAALAARRVALDEAAHIREFGAESPHWDSPVVRAIRDQNATLRNEPWVIDNAHTAAVDHVTAHRLFVAAKWFGAVGPRRRAEALRVASTVLPGEGSSGD